MSSLLPCINHISGCPERFTYQQERRHHMQYCIYQNVTCVMEDCDWVGRLCKLSSHIYSKHQVKNCKQSVHCVKISNLLGSHNVCFIQRAHHCLFSTELFLKKNTVHISCQWIPEKKRFNEEPYGIISPSSNAIPHLGRHTWMGDIKMYPRMLSIPLEDKPVFSASTSCFSVSIPSVRNPDLADESISIYVELFKTKSSAESG